MRKPARAPAAPQPAAIEARGEKEFALDGVTYRLRPSRAAISAIEKQTGMALLELVRAGNVGGLTLAALGSIAAELIRAGADPNDEATRHVGGERIADLIFEEGVMAAQATLTLTLLNAATGGRTLSGELKAATA